MDSGPLAALSMERGLLDRKTRHVKLRDGSFGMSGFAAHINS